jgi:LemA protein
MQFTWKQILAVVGAVLLLWLWTSYNGLVTAREGVDAAWANVEAQYQRRADLLPNLVASVRGASAFESETLQQVTEARTRWLGSENRSERIAAAQEFDTAFARLLVTVESYPALQATQAYRDLMVQLEGTENRIGVARKDYNDAVRTYNVHVKKFPTVIVARIGGFMPEVFFDAAPETGTAPTVEFP